LVGKIIATHKFALLHRKRGAVKTVAAFNGNFTVAVQLTACFSGSLPFNGNLKVAVNLTAGFSGTFLKCEHGWKK